MSHAQASQLLADLTAIVVVLSFIAGILTAFAAIVIMRGRDD